METKNILKALLNARHYCYSQLPEKKGRNNYSGYDYFTPEQIFSLTTEAEKENDLLSKFDLITENNEVIGVLTIYHCESGESLVFKMKTAIPEIKATNITQQLGGAVTYTHRYLLTTAYKIAENQLDFDSDESAKKAEKKEPQKKELKKEETDKKPVSKKEDNDNLPWLNIHTDKDKDCLTETFIKAHNTLNMHDSKITVKDIRRKYKVSKETETALLDKEFINNFNTKKYIDSTAYQIGDNPNE